MQRPTLSRREVLRTGTLTTGTLILGGTATAQEEGRGRGVGGQGFLTDYGRSQLGTVGTVFDIQHLDEGITLRDVPAACGRGAPGEYQAYRIAAVEGSGDAGLFVNPNRTLNTGTVAEFTQVTPACGEAYLDHRNDGSDGTREITRVVFRSSRE